jgi:hypothetical protein
VVPHLFSYFYAEAEMNTETPETNMKTDTSGNRHGKYGANMDEKWMIIGTKRPPESCRKTQVSQVNRQTCSPNLSQLLSVTRNRGGSL